MLILCLVVCVKCTDVESRDSFTDTLLQVVSEPQEKGDDVGEQVSWQRETGVCQFDGVHSLTTKQILHSSSQKNVPHFNHKATLQDQTTVTWQQNLSSESYLRKKNTSNM